MYLLFILKRTSECGQFASGTKYGIFQIRLLKYTDILMYTFATITSFAKSVLLHNSNNSIHWLSDKFTLTYDKD